MLNPAKLKNTLAFSLLVPRSMKQELSGKGHAGIRCTQRFYIVYTKEACTLLQIGQFVKTNHL